MDSLGTPDANLRILFKPLFYWVSIRSWQLYSTTTLPRRDEMKSDDYISSLVPIETEPLHLGVQGRAFQAKTRCGAVWSPTAPPLAFRHPGCPDVPGLRSSGWWRPVSGPPEVPSRSWAPANPDLG